MPERRPRGALAALAVAGALATAAAQLVPEAVRPLAAAESAQGAVLYQAHCAGCHGTTGGGLIGFVPPLTREAAELLAVPGGREYLVGATVRGISAEIEVAGSPYHGVMPPFGHLPPAQVAAILNYVTTAWGNRELLPEGAHEFTALEVELANAVPAATVDLAELRRSLATAREQ